MKRSCVLLEERYDLGILIVYIMMALPMASNTRAPSHDLSVQRFGTGTGEATKERSVIYDFGNVQDTDIISLGPSHTLVPASAPVSAAHYSHRLRVLPPPDSNAAVSARPRPAAEVARHRHSLGPRRRHLQEAGTAVVAWAVRQGIRMVDCMLVQASADLIQASMRIRVLKYARTSVLAGLVGRSIRL
jgi:hypothetical protein